MQKSNPPTAAIGIGILLLIGLILLMVFNPVWTFGPAAGVTAGIPVIG